jgi:hypothetical protein
VAGIRWVSFPFTGYDDANRGAAILEVIRGDRVRYDRLARQRVWFHHCREPAMHRMALTIAVTSGVWAITG